ncbi:hypothetical protein HBH56_201970 [Parastagonospora nodorum]|nr:hypothetical protein HBH56_201970 [Parastagonospora nodorum]KAH4036874.1 hypothetical protein HBI09_078530 [Parastagonospora nodorum]KAH4068416.1 hypothetical protein HBH50_126900 [Parastagonospora nodorum]KAH4078383.1 hypothetical protein HBH48_232490 [Parastagonospora nodorum]KAH4150252.1 hypothetical protein HBH44_185400 [Parastagonospora nodorum]
MSAENTYEGVIHGIFSSSRQISDNSSSAPMVGSAEKIGRLDARRFWWCGGEGLLGNNADAAYYVCAPV